MAHSPSCASAPRQFQSAAALPDWRAPACAMSSGRGEFGHFSSQCALLSEAQMVRLGGLTAAHNARLRSDELQMIFVANSSRCTQQESCFVYSLYSTLIPALVRAVDGSLAVVRFCRAADCWERSSSPEASRGTAAALRNGARPGRPGAVGIRPMPRPSRGAAVFVGPVGGEGEP